MLVFFLFFQRNPYEKFFEANSNEGARLALAFYQEQQIRYTFALLIAGVILSVLIFLITPFLLLPPEQMEMLLFVLAQDNLFHVFFL